MESPRLPSVLADASQVAIDLVVEKMEMDTMAEMVRARVRRHYVDVAKAESCCQPISCSSDYSAAELARIPSECFLGEGSRNPVRNAKIQEGEVVVDLGSGGAIDVFDRSIEPKSGIANVEFHEAVIEKLPLADGVADVVISNCAINLSPDKTPVFREVFRILKPAGRLVTSDLDRSIESILD